MADIFQEVDEEVRKDKAAELWKKYGGYVIGACVAIVIGTAGQVGWKKYMEGKRLEESGRFTEAVAMLDAGKTDDAINSFAALGAEASTGYGVLAQLREAEARIAAKDIPGAVAIYDRLAKDSSTPGLPGLAQVLAAMALFDNAGAGELESRLAPVAASNSPWRFSARELQATLMFREGKVEDARAEYKKLFEEAGVPNGVKLRARQMLLATGGVD